MSDSFISRQIISEQLVAVSSRPQQIFMNRALEAYKQGNIYIDEN